LCPGPDYLFWAVGFYFAWELSRNYRVILVADNHFRDTDGVQRLIKSGILHEFIQFPVHETSFLGIGKAYLRHKHFKRLADDLFTRYRFAAVIQHTDLEPANIYLFKKAVAAGSLRVVYRPSTVAKDYYNDYLLMANWIISGLKHELGVSYKMASALFYLRRFFSYYFNYWLIPLMLTGSVHKPRINAIFRPEKFFNRNPGYFNFMITYSQREKRITEANGEPSEVVRNPLYTCGREANNYLFEGVRERNRILILPTSGEIEHFVRHVTDATSDALILYASKWAEAIDIAQSTFPDFDTYIKCHPMDLDNALFDRVINFLLTKNASIKIISTGERAEKFILESSVIVGTMSSTLWWASELASGKVVISLDLWNVPGGDRYSDVDGIHYVRDLTNLRNTNLAVDRSNAAPRNQQQTLTAFLKLHGNSN